MLHMRRKLSYFLDYFILNLFLQKHQKLSPIIFRNPGIKKFPIGWLPITAGKVFVHKKDFYSLIYSPFHKPQSNFTAFSLIPQVSLKLIILVQH